VFRRRHAQKGLVERDRLDQRRPLGEELHDRVGRLFVSLTVAGDEDRVGAEPTGGLERHGGMHTEGARLVRGRGHDTAVARSAADDERLAAVLGVIALLDRRVEGVEIAVQDGASLDQGAAHATRAPCVFASGAMKRARDSPSSTAATRSARASAPKGRIRRTASDFVVSTAHVPAATPSTRKTASMIAFFEYTAARCFAAMTRSRCL